MNGSISAAAGRPGETSKRAVLRQVTLVICAIGAVLWAYLAWDGYWLASRLRQVGVTGFVFDTGPFVMPLVGLSLSTAFSWWLLKRRHVSLAAALATFSLLAAVLVTVVSGAASAG